MPLEIKIKPKIINGHIYSDTRGIIYCNNNFDMSLVKRMYEIENINIQFKRGWKGHKIEQRWFTCTKGKIEIHVISTEKLEMNSRNLTPQIFKLTEDSKDILHVPSGYATIIKQEQKKSRVLVFADYSLGEINDDWRWPI